MGKSRNRQREDGRNTNNYKYKTIQEDGLPLDKTPDKFLSERRIELKPQNEKQKAYIEMIRNLNMVIATGYAGCVDKDTQFLSSTGWKNISDYQEGDLVAQVYNGSFVNFTKPISYIKQPCDSFNYFTGSSIDQKLSDDHRIVDVSFQSTLVSDFVKTNSTISIYTGFFVSGDGSNIDNVAFLDVLCWLFGSKKDNTYSFNLSDINSNLPVINNVLSLTNTSSSTTDKLLTITYTVSKDFNQFTMCSTPDAHVYNVAALMLLKDNVQHNTDSTLTLTVSDKSKLDQLQFFASACGHTAIIKDNTLNISTKTCQDIVSTSVQSYKSLDGFKYCFEVETGNLLLRSNGHIFVTGNSSKTYCPTMIAAQMLRDKQIDRIVLIRSPVSDEESVGMLKGDLIEKTKYWLMPILDTLNKALSPTLVDLLIKREQILCLAPEFLKGVSFTERDFVIFDEAEDMSKTVALATVTRQGGGKMVLCGDLRQKMISRESGLPLLLSVINSSPKLQEKVGIMDFNEFSDIVRSEDCKDWVKAFCKLGYM